MAVIPTRKQQWWKESVVYQIYPASFKDSNDDGWGDIVGITSKLDHLKDLGVDVVWLVSYVTSNSSRIMSAKPKSPPSISHHRVCDSFLVTLDIQWESVLVALKIRQGSENLSLTCIVVDMGYDISDYESIDPMYGPLEEVDIMIAEMKKRDLKLVMDFVANHTSDQVRGDLFSLPPRRT